MFYSSNETSANNQYNIIKNATFTPINETFQFPKCRRQCKNFYIGRSDFTVVNASIEIRAGDKAEFACKPGYYIEGEYFQHREKKGLETESGFLEVNSICHRIYLLMQLIFLQF